MADMRYYHFLAGYVFTASLLVRIFLYLFMEFGYAWHSQIRAMA